MVIIKTTTASDNQNSDYGANENDCSRNCRYSFAVDWSVIDPIFQKMIIKKNK
jgi:hypothetical protein